MKKRKKERNGRDAVSVDLSRLVQHAMPISWEGMRSGGGGGDAACRCGVGGEDKRFLLSGAELDSNGSG